MRLNKLKRYTDIFLPENGRIVLVRHPLTRLFEKIVNEHYAKSQIRFKLWDITDVQSIIFTFCITFC